MKKPFFKFVRIPITDRNKWLKPLLMTSFAILIVFALFTVSTVSASKSNLTHVVETEQEQNQEQSSQTKNLNVDISSLGKSAMDKYQADFWGLSKEEWYRFKAIKPFYQALSNKSHTTTPVEVLGIFASNEIERRKFAAKYVEKQRLYHLNTQAWMRSVRAEFDNKYPNMQIIDQDKWNTMMNSPLSTSDKVQIWISLSPNCDNCKRSLRRAIREVRSYGNKLDVYIVDTKDTRATDLAIQKFAQEFIPQELFEQKLITINRDQKYLPGGQDVPAVYVSRDGKTLEPHIPGDS